MRKQTILLLTIPPVVAMTGLGVGLWADRNETYRLDSEHAACVARCKAVEAQSQERVDPATGRKMLTAAAVECLGLNRQDLGPKHEYDFGDGCVRGTTSDYDSYGFLLATGIGILWVPFALWMLILAMIRSVVKTVKDASK
ncbi:MAG: hypothetical protein A3C54_01175 [Deltaproteobacteria bacterium RIFCSPHIGHO2_02_FULL_60_17]|nr:MAG: hypothetical protein A3C54_01175 [Deltaproteobacteria bacterium RIFCSPHIGHO2_02_FULL_60_17]